MLNNETPSRNLFEANRKLAIESLKRCPLCGTVNARLNSECFVCRWHGGFDRDPRSVEEGFVQLVEHCPELIDCVLYLPRRRENLASKARLWIERRLRKRLDLHA